MLTVSEFTARLTLYKRELPRRGLFLLLFFFLPATALLAVAAFYFNIFVPPLWKLMVFSCVFFILTLGMLAAFVYMALYSLPEKIGLCCPRCRSFFALSADVAQLAADGKCCKCGEQVLTMAER